MKLRAILSIAVKDCKQVTREKLSMFFLVVYPIMMLFFAATLWVRTPEPVTLSVGVAYSDPTISGYAFNATTIVETMNRTKVDDKAVFNVAIYSNSDELIATVERGGLDAGIEFPPGFSENITGGHSGSLNVYISTADSYKAQITRAILGEFLEGLSRGMSITRVDIALLHMPPLNMTSEEIRLYLYGISFPLNVTMEEVAPETVTTKAGLMGVVTVGMIGIQFLFSGMMQAANAIAAEKERKTLRKILSTPISSWDLLIGKTLAILGSMAFTVLICVLFGTLALGARVSWNPLENPAHLLVPVLLFLGALLTIGMGLVISAVAKTPQGGAGIVMIIAFPLMFLSGVWMPKSMLPPSLRGFADAFPLTQAIDATREIMIFGGNVAAVAPIIPGLVASTLLIYALGVIVFRWTIRKEY